MDDLGKWLSQITVGAVGIWTAVGLIAVALIRQRPITQKLTNEREANLLKERAAEMRRMRTRIATLEAEQRVDRHAVGNLEQCLDTLLMMIEVNPARAAEAAVRVKAMRERFKLEQAAEKGHIFAATIEAASVEDKGSD